MKNAWSYQFLLIVCGTFDNGQNFMCMFYVVKIMEYSICFGIALRTVTSCMKEVTLLVERFISFIPNLLA